MEKTVQVVDEAGIRYEATYPRRAKGLVKNGRARFVDENTICLACPPNKQNRSSEDKEMTNTENIKNAPSAEEQNKIRQEKDLAAEQIHCRSSETCGPEKKGTADPVYSLEYALEMLEKLAKDTSHIHEALAAVASMESEPTIEGSSADEMAKAAAEIVRCREATNQKLIAFYEKMAEDCRPQSETRKRAEFLGWVRDCIGAADHRVGLPDFAEMAELYKSL